MKKILLAFDGTHFSEGALKFARKLNEKEPVFLAGAFLPQVDYANLWSFSVGGSSGPSLVPLLEEEDAHTIKENVKRFESYCHTNGIKYSVHKNYFDFALPELKKESRYADLLILSSELFYKQAGIEKPNEYLQEILQGVECPVIIVPEHFEFPDNIILSYDGSEASVYAIKQFAYLFPELAGHPSLLVYAGKRSDESLPDEVNIKELVLNHFPGMTWFRLETNAKKYFVTWLEDKKGAMLVCGAFGHSDLSMLFRKSFVADVISDHRIPVFIAHR